jgi:hypothetical protein
MRWNPLVTGLLMLMAGTVWIVQGAGALHGSFMTGDPVWLWIGIATDAAGLALCVRGVRHAGSRGPASRPPR